MTQWRFGPNGVQDKGRKNIVLFSFKQSTSGVLPPTKNKIVDEKNIIIFSFKQSPSGVSPREKYKQSPSGVLPPTKYKIGDNFFLSPSGVLCTTKENEQAITQCHFTPSEVQAITQWRFIPKGVQEGRQNKT